MSETRNGATIFGAKSNRDGHIGQEGRTVRMKITPQSNAMMGSTVVGFDLDTAGTADIDELRAAIYRDKILIVKDQHLSKAQFVALGRAMGTIEVYYEPMYQHPEHEEIFVSATTPGHSQQVGVPQTGKFWHADYAFMPRPFGITMTYPQVVPKQNRGTYYIDMGKVFAGLPERLRTMARATDGLHSARRNFKIRPSDVYRPVWELQEEIEKKTPPAIHPTVFTHPVTGEEVLYISEGMTCELLDANGQRLEDGLLHQLLEASGQLDPTFTNEHIHTQRFTEGDLLIWDNRSLVHRALHTSRPEPAVSYRVTVHDDLPFYPPQERS
jgi:taurine dioxygenase